MSAGLLIPGGRGTVLIAPLDLGWEALNDRGAVIEEIAWDMPESLLDAGPEPFVRAHTAVALHRLSVKAPGERPVLIAKSLGTYAAALAAERELPAIWLTPLLHVPSIVDAITRNPAPQLLIGGTADQTWVPEAARATGRPALVIEDANHSLRAPGPLRRFTDDLGRVGTAIEEFLDAL
ncbi:alpha/beta hydrolase [Actinoplanes friuliensis]|uniref:Alpha/beta hydrolase n=1 Tax=Actinoplanes friuliensis DSM 7358 TaxID=1246995 RepID=U5W8Y6_9ACTN|nr:alpha/beta hydrolase [Actinoplanes friuliensis]AGZ44460.1 hypothetical protein AFR_31000 [Actinoplanes friuliensis DSM 7358]